jgi:dephospho-CoA kinase
MLVGLMGKARHGKDTVASLIENACSPPLHIERMAFADAVKARARKFGWDGNKDVNGRALLQYIGLSERAYEPYRWIDAVARRIEVAPKENAVFVITDVRFANEVEWIRSIGGSLWRIVRPNFDNGLNATLAAHPSETETDLITADAVVVNDGDIDVLSARITRMCRQFFGVPR